ncbi:hypothetical protein ACLMJK_008885 [Lecanora helva]
MVDKASEEAGRDRAAQFEEGSDYHPVFCLCNDVPEEYFEILLAQRDSQWIEIITNDPYSESILARSKADLVNPRRSPSPFLNWGFGALYNFHKELLRPCEKHNGRSLYFAYFTFFAIDAACFQSPNKDDWEIIVCSDAADYNESPATGPKLKVFRMKIGEAMEGTMTIETLTSTPKEIGRRCPVHTSVMPPPMIAGPPPVAREVKWRALAGMPEPEGEDIVEVIDT